jgi:hypothetical protein
MAYSTTEQRQFGLKKEAVRGTAETAPDTWFPISKDSVINPSLKLLADNQLRGIPDQFPSVPGTKSYDGKLKMSLDAQCVGEIFYSLLGTCNSAIQGGGPAYKHTFTRNTSAQRLGYTFFFDNGQSIIKKYNLSTVKKVSLTGPVDNFVDLEADIMAKSEAAGSIGTPAFPSPQYLTFQGVTVKIGGSAYADVKSWKLDIDNSMGILQTLGQSQDPTDIMVRGKLNIDGSMLVYFNGETERNKFLAGTTSSLEFLCEGAVIATTYKYTVDVNLPKIMYKAYPFGEDAGLLAANVTFEAVYDTSSTKTIQVDVTNTKTAY